MIPDLSSILFFLLPNKRKTLVSRLTSVFLLLGSKKNKIELKSGIIHKKTDLLIDAKTTVQHNVFFKNTSF